MKDWKALFEIAKSGGVIPVGDYFVNLTPKNGYIQVSLYIGLSQEFKTFTPTVTIPKKETVVKKEPSIKYAFESETI